MIPVVPIGIGRCNTRTYPIYLYRLVEVSDTPAYWVYLVYPGMSCFQETYPANRRSEGDLPGMPGYLKMRYPSIPDVPCV